MGGDGRVGRENFNLQTMFYSCVIFSNFPH